MADEKKETKVVKPDETRSAPGPDKNRCRACGALVGTPHDPNCPLG
jgi:hypothetical protein